MTRKRETVGDVVDRLGVSIKATPANLFVIEKWVGYDPYSKVYRVDIDADGVDAPLRIEWIVEPGESEPTALAVITDLIENSVVVEGAGKEGNDFAATFGLGDSEKDKKIAKTLLRDLIALRDGFKKWLPMGEYEKLKGAFADGQ